MALREGSALIYVIGTGQPSRQGNFVVKIGYSLEPERRLAQLQSGSPLKLKILVVAPGDQARETGLHHDFAKYRQHGEWFALPPAELKRVIRILEGEQFRRSKARQMEAKSASMRKARERRQAQGKPSPYEARQARRRHAGVIPQKGQGKAFSAVRTTYVEDDRPVILVEPLGKGTLGQQTYGFTCPGCSMSFTRTSVLVAVEWGQIHSKSAHADAYAVRNGC